MPKIISPMEVADLNRGLAAAGFTGRIRLHDACGGQSLSLEGGDGLTADTVPADLRAWLGERLAGRGYRPVFAGRGGYFTLG